MLVDAAAEPDGGRYEAEQLGQAIANIGPVGVRALESVLAHGDEHVVAGAVHGLGQVPGWAEAHRAILRDLVFDRRPAVAARSLDAVWGYAESYVCHALEITDRVVDELTEHASKDVRSAVIAYLSVRAPRRRCDNLIAGLSDDDWSVRRTAVARLDELDDRDLLAMAAPHVRRRLDDDIVMRDSAQTFAERHPWPPSDSTDRGPVPIDETLILYSRVRAALEPEPGQAVDVSAFAQALRDGQSPAARRGAADELREQTILTGDGHTSAALVSVATAYRDDSDPRVGQAMQGVVDRARDGA